MSSVVWTDEKSEQLFAESGLDTLDDFLACRLGFQVTEARTRSLRRFELGAQEWYLKLQDLREVQLPLWRIPSYFFKGSPVAREVQSLATLRSLGILVPDLVASAYARGLLPWAAMHLTRAVPGYTDLVAWLEARPAPDEAREVLERTKAMVHQIHDKGYVLLGSKYRNILVKPEDPQAPLALLDQPDMAQSRSTRLRGKDLRLLEFDRSRYAAWMSEEAGG